jgi:bifunctional non-homologous end joining protein LigD
MLASSAPTLPVGSEWSYEVKWDGYRIIAEKTRTGAILWTRNENNVTAQYPIIAPGVAHLKARSVVLDGEIVALDAHGRPSFQALQHRATTPLALAFYVFDVLAVNGRDYTQQPLAERRRALASLDLVSPALLSEPLPGTPTQIIKAIKKLKLEGVVAKRQDSRYRPGKSSDDWVKVRFGNRQEFVVGGRWGEGITAEDMAEMQWVKPSVVVEVSFVEWTQGGVLRHPAFVGMRVTSRPETSAESESSKVWLSEHLPATLLKCRAPFAGLGV